MHPSHPDRLRLRGAGRRPGGAAAAGLALLALGWLLPGQAHAQCAAPDPMVPTIIRCAGADPDGFDAGVDDGVDLTVVPGATVENGANTDTIRLNDSSIIIIDPTAVVTNNAVGGVAASVVDGGMINHAGDIIVNGDGGVGMAGRDQNQLRALRSASIDLDAPNTVGIQARDDSVIVVNEGLILGNRAGSVGIRVGANSPVSNTGNIQLFGSNSVGVELGGSGSTLTNLGLIDMDGAGSVGVLIGAGGGQDNALLQDGTILVGAGGGPAVSFAPSGPGGINTLDTATLSRTDAGTGVAVLGSGASEVVIHRGTIVGSMDLAGGADTFELRGSVEGVDLGSEDDFFELFPGAVFTSVMGGAGNDAVLLSGGFLPGTLDLSKLGGFESLELGSGDWTLQSDGAFSGGITFSDGIGRIADPLTLTGSLALDADVGLGTASTLQVADTLSLVGNYSQADGTTFSAVLDPAATSGRLAVTGMATIQNGAMLEIVEATPFGDSESFTILSATGGINGSFGQLPADTAVLSFALNTVPAGMGQQLVFDVQRTPYAAVATGGNRRAVAAALDGVRQAGPTGDIQLLLTSLDQVSAAGYGAALESLHAEVYDAQSSATFWLGHSFANLAARNLLECKPAYFERLPPWMTGGPACNEDGWTLRVGGFGNLWSRDADTDHIGYDGQGGGIAFALGRPLGPDWEVSGYLGGGFGTLDVQGAGDGSLHTLDLGIAVLRRFGRVQVRSVLDYGHGWHEQERSVRVGTFLRKATGEFESDRVTGLLELGLDLEDATGVALEPVASVDFTWLGQEGFTESGAQGGNLAVEDRDHTVVGTTLGLRLETMWVKHRYVTDRFQWANGVWRPHLDVRWRGHWTGVERDLDGRFAGAPAGTGLFTTQSRDTEHGADVTFGTTFQPYKTRVLLSLGYRGFIGDGSQIHALGADLRIPF